MTSSVEPRRIGGEFELGAAQLAAVDLPVQALPSFGNAHELWLDSGRSALAVIASELRRTAPDAAVWLPAYSCESMTGPFLRASLRLKFYAVGARLDDVAADPAPGDTVLFIHYFGRRNRTALGMVARFQAQGVRVIEDCVQAALTTGVGQHGDFALTSLRKLLPQPDGALLSSRLPLAAEVDDADETFVSSRVAGKLMRGSGAPASAFLPLFEASEARLADNHPRAMSWLSRRLLTQAPLTAIASTRRANFQALRHRIARLPARAGIECLLPALDDGEVPLGLPVTVSHGRRDALRRNLADRGVFCPIHWNLSHVGDGFAQERALSESILTLPVDQRYDDRDMDTIFGSISNFIGTSA